MLYRNDSYAPPHTPAPLTVIINRITVNEIPDGYNTGRFGGVYLILNTAINISQTALNCTFTKMIRDIGELFLRRV